MNAAPLPRPLAIGALMAIATTFGANHVAARLAFDHGTNVVTAVMVRSLGAMAMLLVLLAFVPARHAVPAMMLRRGLVTGALLALQGVCLYSAIARIPVALALLAFNTFPILFALITWAIGGRRPEPRAWFAMPVALAGLALALDAGGWATRAGLGARWEEIGAGVGFAILAAIVFATVMVLNTRWLGSLDGRVRTLMMMTVVAVATLAAGAATGTLVSPRDPAGWWGLAALTLCYGVASIAFFLVLPRIGAVANTTALNIEPVSALALAWIVLGQTVTPIQMVGALIVVGAIVVIGSAGAKPPPPPAASRP